MEENLCSSLSWVTNATWPLPLLILLSSVLSSTLEVSATVSSFPFLKSQAKVSPVSLLIQLSYLGSLFYDGSSAIASRTESKSFALLGTEATCVIIIDLVPPSLFFNHFLGSGLWVSLGMGWTSGIGKWVSRLPLYLYIDLEFYLLPDFAYRFFVSEWCIDVKFVFWESERIVWRDLGNMNLLSSLTLHSVRFTSLSRSPARV